MTEREIQRRLYFRNHKRFRLFLPNYTPRGWWECDMYGVTKAGYGHEFEIKLTMSDFNADANKERTIYVRGETGYTKLREAKCQALESRSEKGPSFFWYVVSKRMADIEVPEWAGLQMLDDNQWFRKIKDAPRLHRVKVADSVIAHALSVCYYRYWGERNTFDHERENWQQRLTPAPQKV